MHTSAAISADLQELMEASNRFGFRLLAWLVEHDADKNVFISSFSVALALTMAYNGAEGKTRAALAELLGLNRLSLQQVNAAYASWMSLQSGLDPKVEFALANSMWVARGNSLSPDFVQVIKDDYAGEAASLDFLRPEAAAIINQWVENKTHEKIKNLVTPEDIRQAILVVINAIYFKGLWSQPFDPARTTTKDFHTLEGGHKPCAMMSQSGHYHYFETGEFQAVRLPYGEGRISLLIFLPKPTSSLRDFQQILSYQKWQMWLNSFDDGPGAVTLPRFKLEYRQDLLESLIALGGRQIAGVDFTGMGAGPLEISMVIHKTFVEVNEEGTEAAAATAIVTRKAIPAGPFDFCADRPFFMAIHDSVTGAILFSGFVLEPA